jgi:AcrR family transcriptional regulator
MAESATVDGDISKGERTRQRLLMLAVERFGAHGFRRTSVSEIARGAGVTQPAAYAYFSSKQELFEAAVDEDAADVLDQARRQSEGVEVHLLVPTLLISVVALLDEHPLVRRVLAGQERDQLRRLLNLPALADTTAWVTAEVRRAQDEGRARTDIDAATFADGAETIVLGLLMAVTQVGGSYEPRRQAGVLAIWNHLLRPPDGG